MRWFVAASVSGPSSGGRFSTVQTNQTTIAASTEVRKSVRRRISAAPSPGRTSTKADAAAKIALTSKPTGIATWKPACSSE
jgi:hypothetical protein